MHLLRSAQGFVLSCLLLIGLIYLLDVLGTRAEAQAPREPQGKFQIVSIEQGETRYGAYILDTVSGRVYHVDGKTSPSLIGQAQ